MKRWGFLCLALCLGGCVTADYGPRPAKWCGWQARQWLGGGPELNVAKNWAKWGTHSPGPCVGCVVVWPHHVGVLTGQDENGNWIVKSGNDNHAVRERARSLKGVIAYRR